MLYIMLLYLLIRNITKEVNRYVYASSLWSWLLSRVWFGGTWDDRPFFFLILPVLSYKYKEKKMDRVLKLSCEEFSWFCK